jgi:hypothetical protein
MKATSYIFLLILGIFAFWYFYYYQRDDVHEPFMDLAIQTFHGKKVTEVIKKEEQETFAMIPMTTHEYWLLPLQPEKDNVDPQEWTLLVSEVNEVNRRTKLRMLAHIRQDTFDKGLKDWTWTIQTVSSIIPSITTKEDNEDLFTYRIHYDEEGQQFVCDRTKSESDQKIRYLFEKEDGMKGRIYGQQPFLESIYLSEDKTKSYIANQKGIEIAETETLVQRHPLETIQSLLPQIQYPSSKISIPHIQSTSLLFESTIPYRWMISAEVIQNQPDVAILLPSLYFLLRTFSQS